MNVDNHDLIGVAPPLTLDVGGQVLNGVGRLAFFPHDALVPWIAIVGARAASRRGVDAARALGAALARDGAVVVSGGAIGVDAAAHEGALDAGGVTVAVLGSALDRPYPQRNIGLFRRIATSGGAVLTPFPDGTPPRRGNFPHRNRFVAQLARAVVVVEGGLDSGALITARFARRLGRIVLATPGSAGTERLLAEGARRCESVDDLRRALAHEPPREATFDASSLGDAELGLLRLLIRLGGSPPAPVSADSLVEQSRLSPSSVLAVLLDLELQGLVERTDAGFRAVAQEAVALQAAEGVS